MNIDFPIPSNIIINMMPIIVGDINSLPGNVKQYHEIVNKCNLPKGSVAYLSINESNLNKGQVQRRPGIHTDGTSNGPWGGGDWGGKGIYLASTDGRCRVWKCESYQVDRHGSLKEPNADSFILKPNRLYCISDRTPHESLPSLADCTRQWFRLVADEIGLWWENHSTASPFGIMPNAPIIKGMKF